MLAVNGEVLEPLSVVRVQWISSSDRDDAEEQPQPDLMYEIDNTGIRVTGRNGARYAVKHFELLELIQKGRPA